jgi:glycosyltransferase involved in cell wall biosynthesis
VLVDDGSTDNTAKIIQEYAQSYDWILYRRVSSTPERKLGWAEVRAFGTGYEAVQGLDHAFVVKLDADLLLMPDYFEQMLNRFHANPKLGIASGSYQEEKDGIWKPVILPDYHAAGAAKMVKVECFNAIRGFPTSPGWDTADEIRAWANGWHTQNFPEVLFYHLKPEGSALGPLLTNYRHGEIYYVCGGGIVFFLGKLLHRMIAGRPPLISGFMLLSGYLHAATSRYTKLVTRQEQRFYRRLLNRRIKSRLTGRDFALFDSNN